MFLTLCKDAKAYNFFPFIIIFHCHVYFLLKILFSCMGPGFWMSKALSLSLLCDFAREGRWSAHGAWMILNPWRVSFWDIITTTTTSCVWQKPLSDLPETHSLWQTQPKDYKFWQQKSICVFHHGIHEESLKLSCQHFLGPFFSYPPTKTRNKSWRT